MSEQPKLELKQIDDREELRSYGYKRLAIYKLAFDWSVANSTMIGADYLRSAAVSSNIAGYTLLRAMTQLLKGAFSFLEQTADRVAGTPALMWAIHPDADALYRFAVGWIYGYNDLDLTETFDHGTILYGTTGSTAPFADVAASEWAAVLTPDPDVVLIRLGWYIGLSYRDKNFPGTTNIDSDAGASVRRAVRLRIVEDAMAIATMFIIAPIQRDISYISIGYLINKIPSEYDFIAKQTISEDWKARIDGQYPATDIETNTGVACETITGMININYTYLPVTLLDYIIYAKSKSWKIPSAAITMVRKYFGHLHSDWDFPTEVLIEMGHGTEHLDEKIGYGIYQAVQLLDSFYTTGGRSAKFLIDKIVKQLHWSYKPVETLCGADKLLEDFTLGSLKGIADPKVFPAVKWAARTEDSSKQYGYNVLNSSLAKDATDAITNQNVMQFLMFATTSKYALYVRGGWTLDAVLDFIWYELVSQKGATTGTKVTDPEATFRSLHLGLQYYTRTESILNYVGPEGGYVNNRIGAETLYNGNLMDQCGISIVLLNDAFTARDVPTRLPVAKYPMPVVLERLDIKAVRHSIAAAVMGRFFHVSDKIAAENVNKNENSVKAE